MKIKKELLFIMLIVFIAINSIYIGNVYAASPVCQVSVNLSKTDVKPGEELNVEVSLTQINEAIAGVGFTMNYDSNLFEYVGLENGTGWNSTKTENSYQVLTANLEGTTNTGKIITIKLKAKSTLTASNTNTISLTSIEATKDDATTEKLTTISKNINITVNQSNDNNNTQNNNTQNNNTQSETKQETQTVIQNNAEKNTSSNDTKKDTSSPKGETLPFAGVENKIIIGSLIAVIIMLVISYILNKKYKI